MNSYASTILSAFTAKSQIADHGEVENPTSSCYVPFWECRFPHVNLTEPGAMYIDECS
ncbi:MAG: hypothetical protein AAGK70_10425 [Pseudomonadota bacterium]